MNEFVLIMTIFNMAMIQDDPYEYNRRMNLIERKINIVLPCRVLSGDIKSKCNDRNFNVIYNHFKNMNKIY